MTVLPLAVAAAPQPEVIELAAIEEAPVEEVPVEEARVAVDEVLGSEPVEVVEVLYRSPSLTKLWSVRRRLS